MTTLSPLKTFIGYICLFLFFSFTLNLSAQLRAFPTALGGGAYASGGRGGNVYHVTSLADDGSVGTFRWALSQPRPATIVFDVSGIIDLLTPLQINGNDLTIAGQTAPEGGITLTYPIPSKLTYGDSQNIIMRYMRVRPRFQSDTALQIYPGSSEGDEASNLIFDHISISYAGLQGFTIRGHETHNITFQNGLIAECKTGSLFGDTDPDFAGYSYDNTFTRTLFYNISHRTPNSSSGRADIYNNVIYDWINRWSVVKTNAQVNHFNNYIFTGNQTSLYYQFQDQTPKWFVNGATNENPNFPPLIYSAGNIVQDLWEDPEADNYGLWIEHAYSGQTEQLPLSFFRDTPFPMIGYVGDILTAFEASEIVPEDAGNYKYLNADGTFTIYRDPQDTRYVNNTINDTPEPWDNAGGTDNRHTAIDQQPYADFLASITGVPINTRPNDFYISNPHIPEIWFQANVPPGEDHNDIAPSGYTWLEEYLNGVDGANAIPLIIDSLDVTPDVVSELRVSETIDLTATIYTDANDVDGTVVNQAGVWTSSDESIATVDENGVVTAIATATEAPFQVSVTITFTITADNGDVHTDSTQITVFPEALQASAGSDQQICEGESLTLVASGGNYYLWNTGETTAEIEVTPNSTTIYSVIVSDDFEQSEEVSVEVIVNPLPIANAGEDQIICEGETITLTATGGDEYLWNTGETTASIDVSPIEESIFTVEVATNGCSSSDEVMVTVNQAPSLIVNEDIAIVEGTSTTLTVSGSDNYLWSTGETTETIDVSPTETTTYTVSSTNVEGCTTEESITVTVVPEVLAEAGEDVTICEGDSVSLLASGGLNYIWNTGETTADIIVSPVVTTTYTVTVEDAYGFSDTDTVTVTVNEAPTISAGDVQYVMIGNSITLTATGGDTYLWDTGETTEAITVNPEVDTTYSVTGFSANGCQNTADVLVIVVEELSASAGNDATICIGDSTTLIASGGVLYEWNTGHSNASYTVSPTETTTYSVTVGDGFGNFDTDEVTVTVVEPPVASVVEDQTICAGDSITLTASGGIDYLWSTGETTSSIVVSPSSNTTYTVEVSNGSCSDSESVEVFVNELPNISVSENITIMETQTTVLAASGSDNYLWSTGETSASIEVSPIETTTYTVSSTNEFGCSQTLNLTVTVVPEVIANAGNDVTICSGESVTMNASGGTSYLWNTGDTSPSPTFSPNFTTVYTVTVSDAYGNTDSDSVTVTVNEAPDVFLSDDVVIIEGESTTLVAEGADSYLWNTGETSSSITVSPNQTTTYTVIGTTNGCSAEAEVTVIVEPIFVASAGEDQDVCQNDNYEVVLTANTGDAYLWSTGETTQSISVTPLSTTTYSVTVFYGSQEDTDDVTVYVNPNPNVQIINGESVEIMSGEFVTLSATGANTYEWNNGATQPNIAVSPTVTTTYEVRGYVGNCYDEKQVVVNVIPEVEADAGEDVEICLGETVLLTADGGDEYLWSNGETSQSIEVTPNETTEYTVTVFNAIDFDEDSVIVFVDTDCEIEPIEGDPLDFNFRVYPNPANDVVNITLEGTTALSRIHLYDITGKLLHSEIISNQYLSMSTTRQIDVSALETGMYFVRLVDLNQEISKQLIIR